MSRKHHRTDESNRFSYRYKYFRRERSAKNCRLTCSIPHFPRCRVSRDEDIGLNSLWNLCTLTVPKSFSVKIRSTRFMQPPNTSLSTSETSEKLTLFLAKASFVIAELLNVNPSILCIPAPLKATFRCPRAGNRDVENMPAVKCIILLYRSVKTVRFGRHTGSSRLETKLNSNCKFFSAGKREFSPPTSHVLRKWNKRLPFSLKGHQ